jgi:hypothetical protein
MRWIFTVIDEIKRFGRVGSALFEIGPAILAFE